MLLPLPPQGAVLQAATAARPPSAQGLGLLQAAAALEPEPMQLGKHRLLLHWLQAQQLEQEPLLLLPLLAEAAEAAPLLLRLRYWSAAARRRPGMVQSRPWQPLSAS